MRSKIGAAVASVTLAMVSIVAAATPARADVPCEITDFSPRSLTVGLSPVTTTFSVETSDCWDVQGWDVLADDFLFYAYQGAPQETFFPWDNSDRGYHDVVVSAWNGDGETRERTFVKGFTLKRRTAWQSDTFNASPEPVRKGAAITVKGRLLVADWERDRYVGYGSQTVSVQFRTPSGSYSTVKTISTRSDGWAVTSVTATQSGYWRVVYGGHSASGSSKVAGDYVPVS